MYGKSRLDASSDTRAIASLYDYGRITATQLETDRQGWCCNLVKLVSPTNAEEDDDSPVACEYSFERRCHDAGG
jgi:hypothetical protein